MYDAALFYAEKIPNENLRNSLPAEFHLCTLHRAENTDDPKRLENIIGALREIAREVPVVLPLHPRTQKVIATSGLSTEGLRILQPVRYFDMLSLLKACRLVLTDSGGLQKEAYFFDKRCLTLRDETAITEFESRRSRWRPKTLPVK